MSGLLIALVLFGLGWLLVLRVLSYSRPALDSAPRFVRVIQSRANLPLDKPAAATAVGGNLFFTNAYGGIFAATAQGKLKQKISLNDGKQRLFVRDVAVGDDGLIYAAVGPTNQINIYNPQGGFLRAFPARRAAAPARPVALRVADGRLYVADGAEHDVKIYGLNGELKTKIGEPGSGRGQFAFPNGIAVAQDGTIYVCDANNSRVQYFSPDGRFLGALKVPGRFALARPKDIEIDGWGRIHVLDTLRGQVVVFDSAGKFLFAYGKSSKDPGFPSSLSIDPKTGSIFITDSLKNSINVWAVR